MSVKRDGVMATTMSKSLVSTDVTTWQTQEGLH